MHVVDIAKAQGKDVYIIDIAINIMTSLHLTLHLHNIIHCLTAASMLFSSSHCENEKGKLFVKGKLSFLQLGGKFNF